MTLPVERYDEQLKTVFRRIEVLEKQRDKMDEEIRILRDAINQGKLDSLSFQRDISAQLTAMSGEFRYIIKESFAEAQSQEIEELKEQLSKKEKWTFWITTLAVGAMVTFVINFFLNTIVK